MTVDRALSQLVTAGLVERRAKSGTYVLNPRATPERANGARLIGLVLIDAAVSSYWAEALVTIESTLRTAGYQLLVAHNSDDPEAAVQRIDAFRDAGVRGIIYTPVDAPDRAAYEEANARAVDALSESGIPFVLFDRSLATRRTSVVTMDSYPASAALVEHLFDMGCRRPLALSLAYSSAIAERENAFCDVLSRHGHARPEDQIVRLPGSRFTWAEHESMAQVLERAPEFDGVFCLNGSVANLVVHLDERVSTLKGVPIVSMRDIEPARPERLARVAWQPSLELAELTATLLVRQIEQRPVGIEQIYLEFTLDEVDSGDTQGRTATGRTPMVSDR